LRKRLFATAGARLTGEDLQPGVSNAGPRRHRPTHRGRRTHRLSGLSTYGSTL
jgi:hypothetical protein